MGGIIHVVGFPKSGTTTLHALLAGGAGVAPGRRKESQYFYEAIETGAYADLRRPAYLAALGGRPSDRWRVDSSPDNVFGGADLAALLADWFPRDHLVVIVVRDPVERLTSAIRFVKSLGILPLGTDVNTWIEHQLDAYDRDGLPAYHRPPNLGFLVAASRYERFVPPWLARFGSDCAVVTSEELRVDGPGAVRRLLEERGLSHLGAGIAPVPEANRTVYARHWGVDRVARRANRLLEPVWHAAPRVKATLRRLYTSVNGRPPEAVELSPRVADRLEEFFAPTRTWMQQVGVAPERPEVRRPASGEPPR